jgi:hypothetical protein
MILLGIPIHESKDYCFKDWLGSIRDFPVDILLVDNSSNELYSEETVEGYLKDLGMTNVSSWHIEIDPTVDPGEKIARSREIIRERVIEDNYDYWFSLESDLFVPQNALDELLRFGDEFHAVHHSYPNRIPEWKNLLAQGFGCSLIKREALEKYGFLKEYGSVDPLTPNCWHGGEAWFNYRLMRNGWKFCDLHNVIKGIEHRNE